MDKERKDKLGKKVKLFTTILKFALLIGILIGLPLYIYFFKHDWITNMSSLENVRHFFEQYKQESIPIYIVAQVIQIVICIIPGQWLQLASGFMHGFWLGYLLSIIGAIIGTVLTYYLAKLLGRDAMHLIFGEKKVNDFMEKLNSKKALIIVFLIFLIPGVPKDLCNYAAGLSDMKLKTFLLVSLVGRSPGMMGSLLIGKQLKLGGYTWAIGIAVVAILLFILGIIYRKKIMRWFDKAYDKLM